MISLSVPLWNPAVRSERGSPFGPFGARIREEFAEYADEPRAFCAVLQDSRVRCTLESSPIRIAVTRAWARLLAPSFW